MGDALITKDGELIILPDFPRPTRSPTRRSVSRPWSSFRSSLVLTTHGEPVRENGEEALRKALLQSST